jgi:AraC family transcriptional activator of pobA
VRHHRLEDAARGGGPVFVNRPGFGGAHGARASISHEFAALAFFVDGSARVEQRATWALEPGDVLIVPAGEPHRRLEARRPDTWGLGVSVAGLAGGALLEPFERVRDGAAPVVHIPSARGPFLQQLFAELRAATTAPVQTSLLTLILHEVTRAAAWSTEGSSRPGVVAESLRFIERNCLGPLTLQEVAAAVGRTPSYVTTALKRATGRSAVAWITAGRMGEARRRLLHSDERVERIAWEVGYADPTHFIRQFRRTHGATPAAWRAAHRAT